MKRRAPSPRLADILAPAETGIAHLEPATRDRYTREWKSFADQHRGATLADLTTPFLARWVAKLCKAGLEASTVNSKVSAVAMLLPALERVGLRAPNLSNPFAALVLPRIDQRIRQTPTPDQFRAMLGAAKDARERAILLVLGHGGFRVGEAMLLRREDFDLERREARVEPGKTHRGRVVALSVACCEALAAWPWVPPSRREFEGVVLRAGRAAGVPFPVKPQCLRRASAALLREAGAEDGAIVTNLGNSIRTLHRAYLAPDDSSRRAAADRM